MLISSGDNCYPTHAFSGALNEAEWLHQLIGLDHPCLLGAPMVGRDQCGYITPVFCGSPWWSKMNLVTATLSSWGPHGGERSI